MDRGDDASESETEPEPETLVTATPRVSRALRELEWFSPASLGLSRTRSGRDQPDVGGAAVGSLLTEAAVESLLQPQMDSIFDSG